MLFIAGIVASGVTVTLSVMDSDVVSMLVSTGSVDRTSLGIDSVENNAAKVTSTTLVDVAVSVLVNGSVVSGTFASDDGVFVIVLTGTVVPGDSEVDWSCFFPVRIRICGGLYRCRGGFRTIGTTLRT